MQTAPLAQRSTSTHGPLLALRGAGKRFARAGGSFDALSSLDLDVDRGEFVAVVGASGSGKSTLLNLLAGIDRASSGSVQVAGQDLGALSEGALAAWRGRGVGIVFQFFQLLPTLTAVENVMLPMDFGRVWPARERLPRALALLDQLGIAEQAHKFPSALSGGQQQRAAVARALANAPPLLLADEPTGNLDSASGAQLLAIFSELVSTQALTIVMVTHEAAALRHATRVVRLADGRIVGDGTACDD